MADNPELRCCILSVCFTNRSLFFTILLYSPHRSVNQSYLALQMSASIPVFLFSSPFELKRLTGCYTNRFTASTCCTLSAA